MPRLTSHLYVRIYLALLGSLVVASLLFALVHLFVSPGDQGRMELLGQLAEQVLAPPDAPPAEQLAALERWRGRELFGFAAANAAANGAANTAANGSGDMAEDAPRQPRWRTKPRRDLALYDVNRHLLAAVGHTLPAPSSWQTYSGPMPNAPRIYALHLSDGRWLIVRRGPLPRQVSVALFVLLGLTAAVVGVAAYPVVRRITRRLERLQRHVQDWGAGDLGARVAVEGDDEVARLAVSFNESAARIEALVGAQKKLLANASHELRSPLARIRMAVELMEGQAAPALRDELKHNIAELDQLIEEVLLASRLDALPPPDDVEVDLTAVVAEECARVGAAMDLAAVTLPGDGRLLRRLVRNLLENGTRYGGPALDVMLGSDGREVRLEVCDRGPGVPEEHRERIFEAFYRVPGASEKAGGVGLGLALVRQIAQRHRGRVECLPRAGGGSCFAVTLPLPSQAGLATIR